VSFDPLLPFYFVEILTLEDSFDIWLRFETLQALEFDTDNFVRFFGLLNVGVIKFLKSIDLLLLTAKS
jgi:hypothetical protein